MAVVTLRAARSSGSEYREDDREAFIDAERNALIARNAERYQRAVIRGGATACNAREHHTMDTLDRLLAHHGPDAKGIDWAHATHVGDARFTTPTQSGMINLGQLAREAHDDGTDRRDGAPLRRIHSDRHEQGTDSARRGW